MLDNSFSNSKPCENCIRILKSCQINRVFYTLVPTDSTEILYRMEKVSEITADHVSKGNRALNRNKN